MEEKQKKSLKERFSKKKLAIIFFTLAIVFAILGFVDLQANAAELQEKSYIKLTYKTIVREDSGIENGYVYADWTGCVFDLQLDSGATYAILRRECYSPGIDSPVGYDYYVYQYDESKELGGSLVYPINIVPTPSSLPMYKYSQNGVDTPTGKYQEAPTVLYGNWSSDEFYENYTETTWLVNVVSYSTNVPIFTEETNMTNYFLTGDTTGQVVDLDTSEYSYNSAMPVPTDIQLSRQDIYTTDDDALTRFLLYSWNNTSDEFYIEMETQPYMAKSKFLLDWSAFDINPLESGLFASRYVVEEEYVGSWERLAMYEPSTSRQMYRLSFFEDKYAAWVDEIKSNNYSILDKALGKQISDGALINLRIRYVDPVTRSYGNWCSLIITKDLGVCLYVQDDNNNILEQYAYEKGFYTVVEQPGTQDNVVDSVVSDSVNERQDYFDEYGSLGSDDVQNSVDVQEATNWLQTVISFIKNTPQLIGAVIVFLPHPILYGIYVVIFLGVIAAGIAIVKALI